MSDRRSEDENFVEECKRGQAKAVETVGFMQHFMTSSLQAINDLTRRVTKNESEISESVRAQKKITEDHVRIIQDHKKILSLLDDNQRKNNDGFSQIISKLDTQERLIDSLSNKERKRSLRENIAKGVIYAFVLSLAVMGVHATTVILFGEEKVQKVIDLKNGKVN